MYTHKRQKMSKCFVFIPNNIQNPAKFYGIFEKQGSETSFYLISSEKSHKSLEYLGIVGKSPTEPLNFVTLSRDFSVQSVRINGNIVSDEVLCIKYDKLLFEKSRLFQGTHRFQKLAEIIRKCDSSNVVHKNGSFLECLFYTFVLYLTICLNQIIRFCSYFDHLIPYSSVATHLNEWLSCFKLILKDLEKGSLDLKTRNLVLALFFDIISGYILVYYVLQDPSIIMRIVDSAVSNLRELLQWLMGSPVGLKLNNSFNVLLGQFFLYHINLWWTFLMVGAPLVQWLHSLLWFGPLGLTFVMAVLADLIALGTFHVYCIYVYAARFYRFQIMGLCALWRLFLGRKFNPLRNRVDSCQYSHRQLFVGTLAFTILLFLLPTTTLYYAVFATLRLCLLTIHSILYKVRLIFQNFPLYLGYLWITKAPIISGNIRMELDDTVTKGAVSLFVTLEPTSWKEILNYCSIQHAKKTQSIATIIQNVFAGHLL